MSKVVFFLLNGEPRKDAVLRTAMAHAANRDEDVVLVTDSDRHQLDDVTLIPYERFAGSVADLQALYRHHSSNNFNFEFSCYARWFVYRDLAKEIGQFYILDRDLLLFDGFSDVDRLLKPGQFFDTAWFNTVSANDGVAAFCEFILETYRNDRLFDFVRRKVNEMFAWPADRLHFSDMCSLYVFQTHRPDLCARLRLGIGNRLGFDTNIHGGMGYEAHLADDHGLIKKVYWKDDRPYCRRLSDGAFVRFRTLHFQGRSKPLMTGYAALRPSESGAAEFLIEPHRKAAWWSVVRAELDAAGGRLPVPEGARLVDPLEAHLPAAA